MLEIGAQTSGGTLGKKLGVGLMIEGILKRLLTAILAFGLVFQQVAYSYAQSGDLLGPDVDPLEVLFTLEELTQLYIDEIGPEEFSASAMASILDFNPEAVSAYLSEKLVYRPYSGALKSPDSIWTDREANALDVALMLADILELDPDQTRIARGSLSEETALAVLTESLVERADLPEQPDISASTLATALDAGLTAHGLEGLYYDQRLQAEQNQLTQSEWVNDLLRLSPGLLDDAELSNWQPLTPASAVAYAQDHAWLVIENEGVEIILDPFADRYRFQTPIEESSIQLSGLKDDDPTLFAQVSIRVELSIQNPDGQVESRVATETSGATRVFSDLNPVVSIMPSDPERWSQGDLEMPFIATVLDGLTELDLNHFTLDGQVTEGAPPQTLDPGTQEATEGAANALQNLLIQPLTNQPEADPTSRVIGAHLAIDIRQPGTEGVEVRRPIVPMPSDGGQADEIGARLFYASRIDLLTSLYTSAKLDWDHLNQLPEALASARTYLGLLQEDRLPTGAESPPLISGTGKVLSVWARNLELGAGFVQYASHPTIIAEHSWLSSEEGMLQARTRLDLMRIGYQTMSFEDAVADAFVASRLLGVHLTSAENIVFAHTDQQSGASGFLDQLLASGQPMQTGQDWNSSVGFPSVLVGSSTTGENLWWDLDRATGIPVGRVTGGYGSTAERIIQAFTSTKGILFIAGFLIGGALCLEGTTMTGGHWSAEVGAAVGCYWTAGLTGLAAVAALSVAGGIGLVFTILAAGMVAFSSNENSRAQGEATEAAAEDAREQARISRESREQAGERWTERVRESRREAEEARRERDEALRERDEARRERDEARTERNEAWRDADEADRLIEQIQRQRDEERARTRRLRDEAARRWNRTVELEGR